jgi:hypothetical protein
LQRGSRLPRAAASDSDSEHGEAGSGKRMVRAGQVQASVQDLAYQYFTPWFGGVTRSPLPIRHAERLIYSTSRRNKPH